MAVTEALHAEIAREMADARYIPACAVLLYGWKSGRLTHLGIGLRWRLRRAPLLIHTGCAVSFTPSARTTFITVSNRGLAPGASALYRLSLPRPASLAICAIPLA